MKNNLLKSGILIAFMLTIPPAAPYHAGDTSQMSPKQERTTHDLGIYQQSGVAFPAVSFAAVPLYPAGAVPANIQGVVRVKVTTDGSKLTAAIAEKGSHPVLARAAEANARTWQFAVHEPTTFTVTYRYKLVDDIEPVQNNPRVTLRLPTEVGVEALRWPGTVDLPAKIK